METEGETVKHAPCGRGIIAVSALLAIDWPDFRLILTLSAEEEARKGGGLGGMAVGEGEGSYSVRRVLLTMV